MGFPLELTMWWYAQTTYFIPAARLLCEALTFPCGTTQSPTPGEETASGRGKVCFKTEQGVYNHPAADVVLKKHGRATGCGQSCPLTARVNNDVMIWSGLDLDQHEPWLLQTFLPCICIHHPCQKWHIYLTSPVLYDTHCKPERQLRCRALDCFHYFYEKLNQFGFNLL